VARVGTALLIGLAAFMPQLGHQCKAMVAVTTIDTTSMPRQLSQKA